MPAPNISISISTFLACLTTAAHALLLVAHEKKKKNRNYVNLHRTQSLKIVAILRKVSSRTALRDFLGDAIPSLLVTTTLRGKLVLVSSPKSFP